MATIKGLSLRGDVYWFQYQVAGHRTRVSLQTKDLEMAIIRAREIRGTPLAGTPETIAALVDNYTLAKVKAGRFSESTRRAAKTSLNMLGAYCTGLPVGSVTTKHVQGWFDRIRKNATEATAQTHLNRVKGFFRWCKDQNLVSFNPCGKVSVGKVAPTAMKRFCTKAQRDFLIDEAPEKSELRFILYCGFYGGLRRGEIVEARPDWFDLKAGLLHVRLTDSFTSKDREERTIPLAKPFAQFLKTFPLNDKFCIGGHKEERGKSLYRYDFRRPFNDHVKACELAWVTPHTMRHTFASLLVSQGKSVYKVAVWLGDGIKVVQKHYAKLLPNDDDINALR
jgi:integrase